MGKKRKEILEKVIYGKRKEETMGGGREKISRKGR